MSRKDVTENTATSFDELALSLRAAGFDVDHFHANDGDWITHFNQDATGHFVPDGDCDESPQGWVSIVADEWHE